jgi:hypothetical protein
MLLSRLVRVTALLCLPASVFAQGKFEGVVTARLSSLQGPGSVATYSIKGEALRMDMTGASGASVTLLNDKAHSLNVMLMHQQRMVMDVSTMSGPGQAGAKAAAKSAAAMKMLGKKETIAGRVCEHVLVTTEKDDQLEICLAKGLGSFVMGSSMGGRGSGAEASQEVLSRLGADAFPLKIVDMTRGKTLFLVTKIEQKPLDDSLFKIPDGYQKIDMGRVGRPGL